MEYVSTSRRLFFAGCDSVSLLDRSLEDNGVLAYTEPVGEAAIQWEYCFRGGQGAMATIKASGSAHHKRILIKY